MVVIYNGKAEVALHPEGVDRNEPPVESRSSSTVALHPEGVDRNKNEYAGKK